MKVQEKSILKYLDFLVIQSPLGFSADQTDYIIELLNEWFPTEKFRKVDTHFSTDSIYDKELMYALPLIGNSLMRQKWNIMENLDIFLEGYNTYLL